MRQYYSTEGHTFLVDSGVTALCVKEIMEGDTYPPVSLADTPIRTIVDIGANVGAAAVKFHRQYPDALITCYEPHPDIFTYLHSNTVHIPRIECHRAGVGESDREMTLYMNEDSVCSSHLPIASSTRLTTVNIIDALRLPDEIDILKIDTEGMEYAILHRIKHRLERIKVIYLEYHNHDDRLMIDSLLSQTHVLVRGRISDLHRGELCYVLEDLAVHDDRKYPIAKESSDERRTIL